MKSTYNTLFKLVIVLMSLFISPTSFSISDNFGIDTYSFLTAGDIEKNILPSVTIDDLEKNIRLPTTRLAKPHLTPSSISEIHIWPDRKYTKGAAIDHSTEALTFSANHEIREYSINLMWLNSVVKPEQYYIDEYSVTASDVERNILLPAIKWAKANPTGEINIWYDSLYTMKEAIRHTKEVLTSIAPYADNIHFRDIREIPVVKDNAGVFSNKIPVVFRIDLLKLIIIVDEVDGQNKDAAIFSDFDVGDLRPLKDRMNKEELFGSGDILRQYIADGLILNKGRVINCAQFLQLMKNKTMISAIKTIINVNLLRAVTVLNFDNTKGPHNTEYTSKNYSERRLSLFRSLDSSVFVDIQQTIFSYYKTIIPAAGDNRLMVRPDILGLGNKNDPWVTYTPEKYGYGPFGLYGNKIYNPDTGEEFEQYDVLKRPAIHLLGAPSRVVDVDLSEELFPSYAAGIHPRDPFSDAVENALKYYANGAPYSYPTPELLSRIEPDGVRYECKLMQI
jgi:hypothetical protein